MTPNARTTIDEIADSVFQITTRLPDIMPGGFTFNQFLIRDDEPLLFHTGPRGMFDLVKGAVAEVIDPTTVRWVGYSHLEADECGALNQWLAIAPRAEPVCSSMGAQVFLMDSADRPARGLAHGERLQLGARTVRWLDAPHVPHGHDCGYLFEETGRTLFCGDLFAQVGSDLPVCTDGDIFAASEALREHFPYAPVRNASEIVEGLALTEPSLLACMHGASHRGNGAELLRRLARALAA
jgi:flavorubredoxin